MTKRLRAIRRLRRLGIEYPKITYEEAKRAKLPLAIACAVLEQESGGGRNVFGHDPTIFVGAGKVTKEKYLAYKRERDRIPGKRRMQGVGPMQLTWYAYQDLADEYGGCWKPRYNIRVGFEILARSIKKYGSDEKGLRQAFRVYNGSYAYADQVLRRVERWRRRLDPNLDLIQNVKLVEPNQGFDSLHESLWKAYAIARRRGFTDLGTYANKPGDHGYHPALAFDLGDQNRFFYKGWAYLKARRMAKFFVRYREELNIDYVILGMSIWSLAIPFWHRLRTGDTSHMFHIHVSGTQRPM